MWVAIFFKKIFHDWTVLFKLFQKITIHSKYSTRSRQNDIALIKLKKPVEYTNYLKPICLSTKNPTNPKENFTITGFGTIDTDSKYFASIQWFSDKIDFLAMDSSKIIVKNSLHF